MRIYGELIGKLTARTNRDSALVDRVLKVYKTKTTIKLYLFKSYNIGWQKECNVVFQTIIKKEDDANKVIKKIMRDYNLNFDGHITIDNKNILEYLNGKLLESKL
jgi:E3 ubiquitin-protein ligase DOA10